MSEDVCVWAVADASYEIFVAPFIFFALYSEPRCRVAVGLDEQSQFDRTNSDEIEWLLSTFPGRVSIERLDFSGLLPNSVRFLRKPELHLPYTYICDVDIFITEPFANWHELKLHELGLPHSNVLRDDQLRLSGLHFTRTADFWPVDWDPRFQLAVYSDERLLFDIIKRKNHLPPLTHKDRPVHGVHVSLFNRFPLSDVGWGLSKFRIAQLDEVLGSPLMESFLSVASPSTRALVRTVALFGHLVASQALPIRAIPFLTGGGVHPAAKGLEMQEQS